MLRPVTDLSNDALHSSLNPVIEQRYRRLSIHSGASSLNAVRSLVNNSASDGRGRSALWPARRHVSLLSCRSGPVRGGGMAAEEAPAAGYTGSVPIPLRRRSVIDLIRMAVLWRLPRLRQTDGDVPRPSQWPATRPDGGRSVMA